MLTALLLSLAAAAPSPPPSPAVLPVRVFAIGFRRNSVMTVMREGAAPPTEVIRVVVQSVRSETFPRICVVGYVAPGERRWLAHARAQRTIRMLLRQGVRRDEIDMLDRGYAMPPGSSGLSDSDRRMAEIVFEIDGQHC